MNIVLPQIFTFSPLGNNQHMGMGVVQPMVYDALVQTGL